MSGPLAPGSPVRVRSVFVIWFTGLPCSSKTTLSKALHEELFAQGISAELLDGDELRKTVSADLGFTTADREKHIGRVTDLAASVVRSGSAAIVAAVAPLRSMRSLAKSRLTPSAPFIEVHVRCPLVVCESRDVKGMYRLAREGKIERFTGISDFYEVPDSPDVLLDTAQADVAACLNTILVYLRVRKLI